MRQCLSVRLSVCLTKPIRQTSRHTAFKTEFLHSFFTVTCLSKISTRMYMTLAIKHSTVWVTEVGGSNQLEFSDRQLRKFPTEEIIVLEI